jgi:DNA anti-recombination protein RmuC
MHASPQKVVNRAPAPVIQRASSPAAATVVVGPAMRSPYTARFAGSIAQHESGDGGKRMYRTGDGQTVELPPDMTVAQAAELEAEARVATKQLGKGPRPQPVPDVKKLARKEEKKESVKLRAQGKGFARGRGKTAPRIRGAAAGLFLAVGKSKVAQYLAARGTPALVKGIGMLQKLSQNEQTHDDAAEKLTQSEKAVVIPPSEGQSKSNTGQVNTVSERPAPAADENKAKQKLHESLEANTPQSIEDVDNFKRDMKAQHMGADVMQVVQGDKNAVTSTFGDMVHTPLPTPPEHKPEALPPEEIAPPTPVLNLGQGTIAPLQKEHTDVSNYTKEADSKLKEEGVTQEQLDMVDSGDLAEANKAKKGLEKAVQTEPVAVQEFARQQSNQVDKELKQEEKRDRDGLRAKRKADLGAAAQKQKGTQSALEKKRDEVASKINGIYQTAQDKVKKKLADLETQSMKRFDDGNAKATKDFEDNVNREIDAFKDDRYSGFWGGAKRAKDWLLGMDDLPEVKAIFDRNRAAFVSAMHQLVESITADNKRVIQECKDELANARKAIKEYVDQLEPSLKGIGKTAAQEMNAKLNELDQFIGRKEEELQTKLKDKQTAAIKAIDEKIEKMKEAMSGALAKLGNLLLWAAKKFFTWALQKFGYSLEEIEGIINKGAAVLKAIFTQPIQFVKNLMKAAITGFQNFGKNFLTHLKDALFEWLTGSLEGLVLPKTWDFPGIIGVALQMIGISYQNIRTHMVTVMGEPVVAGLEKTFTLVKTLITEGPMAAWEQLKEMAGEMRDAFIEAVKDFIKMKIIEQAIQWLVSLFIPGAGIIKAVIGIYDTIVFFIQKAKQIVQMISNFLGSIAEIAAGNIGAAADAMENGLARGLSLVISFLAQLLHLSGITSKIRDAIQKIRGKVDAVLLKVAKWIAEKAKKLFAKVFGKKDDIKQEDSPESDGVRSLARKALVAQLSSPHTKEQAASITAAVLEQYKPQGLKRLWLKEDQEGITYDIWAEASDPKKVARLMRKRHSVTLRATIEVLEPLAARLVGVAAFAKQAKKDQSGRVIMENGEPVMEVIPNVGGAVEPVRFEGGGARSKAAAGLVTPFAEGATEIEVHTWNVGEAQQESSTSHAERQLQAFLDRNSAIFSQIKTIHVQITDSPCADCIKTLISIRAGMPKNAKATLTYERPYKNLKDPSKSTTSKMLAALKSADWSSVQGPPVDAPAEMTAEPVR